jgi:hypothetical protein
MDEKVMTDGQRLCPVADAAKVPGGKLQRRGDLTEQIKDRDTWQLPEE